MDFFSILERFIEQVAGKEAIKLLNLMKKRDNISEFELAEELNTGVNQVRNLLYKLNSLNLVYSTRKKDKDKGLYIYYWTVNFKHALYTLKIKKNEELAHLQEELKKENDQRFYVCKNSCIRLELEEAMEYGFKCNECGSLLDQEDTTKKIGEINHKITMLTQELEELDKPLKIMFREEEKEIKVKKKGKKIKKAKKIVKKFKKTKKGKVKKKGKKIKKAKKIVKKFKKTKKKVKIKKSSKILNKLKKIRF